MTKTNHKPAAIIWDMDGVLVDNNEFHYQSWVAAYGQHYNGEKSLSREAFAAVFGMGNPDTVARLFGETSATPEFIAKISGLKEETFREKITETGLQMLPGVQEWLTFWQAAGVKQAVGSSAPQLNVEAILNAIEGWSYFDAVICSESAGIARSKPAPDIFLKAAESLDVPPAACLVIEDAVVGIEAAKAAGMRCVAVSSTHPAEALGAANLVVENLNHLSPERLLELWAVWQ